MDTMPFFDVKLLKAYDWVKHLTGDAAQITACNIPKLKLGDQLSEDR